MSESNASRRKRARVESPALYNHSAQPVISRALDVSADGRRILNQPSQVNPPAPPPILPMDWDPNEIFEPIGEIGVKIRAARYTNSDFPLTTWIPLRDEYLDETMRLEGRGDASDECAECRTAGATLQCEDCIGNQLVCPGCCVLHHQRSPLHRIKRWTGEFFEKTSLQELGLRVQLLHPPGKRCTWSEKAPAKFVVLHTTGIHRVSVDFCGCVLHGKPKVERRVQLMRTAWWPASTIDPQTCATFALLKDFHLLSLQGKLSVFDYYHALELKSNSSGTEKVPYRLPQLTLMVREWRHAKMLRWAGAVHSLALAEDTPSGSLAVQCRACPQPGMNLPDGWEQSEDRWLYVLILCMDTCFRLNNRLRSSDARDPALGPGLAYLLDSRPYHEHLKHYINKDEISSCAGFAAIFLANLKRSEGMCSTGVGGVACARHELWRPTGIGNLQKGERYANMDYIFASSVAGLALMIVISYDIACQWIKNLWNHVQGLPTRLQPAFKPEDLTARVPAFHLDAHGKVCHAPFSLRFTHGVGRTDGEAIERLWAILRGAAAQTKEMGPGGRHNVLDDFCGFSNWLKTVDIGNLLLKRLIQAIPEAVLHWRAYVDFEEGLRADRPLEIANWETMLKVWEADHKMPCPYSMTTPNITMAKVKLKLAEDELRKSGLSADSPHTPSTFLLLGMEIEGLQRTLYADVKAKKDPTVLQRAGFEERHIALRKKIVHYRELQATYMPGLYAVLTNPELLDDSAGTLPEKTRLYMPSELGVSERRRACVTGITKAEAAFRFAEISEALEDLRRYLRTRTYLSRWKIRHVTGQRSNTRARALQHRVDVKVHAAAVRYRHSRRAYLALEGPGDWAKSFKELHDDDVRSLNERQLTDRKKEERARLMQRGERALGDTRQGVPLEGIVGEGQRKLSWIWFVVNINEDENSPHMQEALRVEWAKSKARAGRWCEEVKLLCEEMRRVIAYGRRLAECWDDDAQMRLSAAAVPDQLQEGLQAYASEHAAMESRIAGQLEEQWATMRKRACHILAGDMVAAEAAEMIQASRAPVYVEVVLDEEDIVPQEED
ncbi:hypothetical protein FIBSPDRAFT_956594 [Athelia psychrophila]|uniref:CxC2-like cysteine cluster KDZ transposase-associated domain-containing protein n=1 Tax=Athelia psychrophila TaxID=1759441 RepID=A0A166GP58_9AGAM|nr:hypothetical protein FIBSPDRAFT_956594 [Fibularhizoctonia sp. CBS 109695]